MGWFGLTKDEEEVEEKDAQGIIDEIAVEEREKANKVWGEEGMELVD